MTATPLAISEGPYARGKLQDGLRAFEQCQWLDAVACFREVLAQDPGLREVAAKLAFALSQAREYDQAIEVLNGLCEQQPQSAKWPYMVGYQFYMRSAWGDAVEWFNKALALRPTYVKVLYRKAYALHQLNRDDECVGTLHGCIEQWQRLSPDRQQAESKNYGKANFLLGKVYLGQGLSLKARRPLQVAVQLDIDDPYRRYELGKCLLKNGQVEAAIRELEHADVLRPGTDYVLDRLAQAHSQQGDLKKAEELYSKIPQHRRRPFILKNLGQLYLKQDRADEALEVLREATKRDHTNHNLQHLLAKALQATGRHQAAILAYEAAIKLKLQHYGADFVDAREALQRLKDEKPELVKSSGLRAEPGSGEETGTISYYNEQKGFGFILSRGERIFFHVSAIVDEHRPAGGANVAFRREQSVKGPRAVGVRLLNV